MRSHQGHAPTAAKAASKKKRKAQKFFVLSSAALASAGTLATKSAYAANQYWDGTANNWSSAHWSPNAGGGSLTTWTQNNTANFNDSTHNSATVMTVDGGQSISGMVFANTSTTLIQGNSASPQLIRYNSGNLITVNSGAGAVTIGGDATHLLNFQTLSSTASTITNNSSSLLSIVSNFNLDNGSGSAGPLVIQGNGTTSITGTITQSVGLPYVAVGSLSAAADNPTVYLTGANTFTGPASGSFIITKGTVYVGASSTGTAGNVTTSPLGKSGVNDAQATVNIFGNGSGSTQLNGPVNLYTNGAFNVLNKISWAGSSTSAFNTTIGGATANTSTFGGAIAFNGGGNAVTFTQVASGTVFFTNSISGATPGLLVGNASNTGTVVLSGTNNYTGPTSVVGGILNIRSNTALGSTTGATTVLSGAALQTQGGITVTGEALTLNGTGISAGGALQNVSGDNSWTGTVALGSAARINSDSGTLTISGGITGTGLGLTLGGAGNTVINTTGINTGSGGTVTKDGNGRATVAAASNYTGTTTVSAGALNIQNSTGLGTVGAGTTVANNAALELQGGINVGAETLSLTGTGNSSGGVLRNISGNNTYGGVITTANASNLITSDAGAMTISGTFTNNFGTLTFGGNGDINITATNAFNNNLQNFFKSGNGVLTISGSAGNAITNMAVTVNGGTLLATNTTNSAIGVDGAATVNSGGTIGGTGNIGKANNSVIINSGGHISPGLVGQAGILSVNNFGSSLTKLDLKTGSILDYNLGAPTILSPGTLGNDYISVLGGTTTLNNGTLLLASSGIIVNITPGSNFANGSFRLIKYTASPFTPGTISNFTTVGSTSPTNKGYTFKATTDSTNNYFIDLDISAITQYWDTDNTTPGAGGGSTPSGTWDTVTSNWSNNSAGNVATTTWGIANDAVFSAGNTATGAFNVTVSGTQNANSILIEEGTVSFNTGSLNISGTGGNITTSGGDAIVNGLLTQTTGLTKAGTGSLTLNNANNYTGTTTIKAGTVFVGAAAPNGSAGALGATAGAVLLGDTSGTFSGSLLTSAAVAVAKPITVQSGNTGTMTIGTNFAGTSTFTGNIATSTPVSTAKDVTFVAVTNGTVDIQGVIGESTSVTGVTNITVSDGTKLGTVKFSNVANNYDGSTTVNGGTLEIVKLGNGNANSSIGNSGNTAANLVIDNAILKYTGTGDTTDRRFTFGTNGATVDSSATSTAVSFTNAGLLATPSGASNRTLTLTGTNTNANLLASIIPDPTGGGKTLVTKTGAGNWVLGGNNNYTGDTTISTGGTLTLNTSGSITQTATINISDGTFNTNAKTNFTAGALQTVKGQGLWVGSTSSTTSIAGTLSIGQSHGLAGTSKTLNVNVAGSTLALNGTSAERQFDLFTAGGSADHLSVSGQLVYGGTLKIANPSVFSYAAGQTWDLFDSTTETGTFTNNSDFNQAGGGGTLPGLAANQKWLFNYGTGELSISTAIPNFIVPSTLTINTLKNATNAKATMNTTNNGTWTGNFATSVTGTLAATASGGPVNYPAGTAPINVTFTGTTSSYNSVVAGTVTVTPNVGGSNVTTVTANVGNAIAEANANNRTSFGQNLTGDVVGGGSYAGLASRVVGDNAGNTEKLNSEAVLLAGKNANADATETVSMAWRTRNSDELFPGSTPPFANLPTGLGSDIVQLTGMVKTGGQSDSRHIETDAFALQMSYLENTSEASDALQGHIFLVWLDNTDGVYNDSNDKWVNATAGNFQTGSAVFTNVQGGWSVFAAANSPLRGGLGAPAITDSNLGSFMGSWGVDTNNDVVWSVLDHNSSFAVVPEPSAFGIVGLAGMGLLGARKRRAKKK